MASGVPSRGMPAAADERERLKALRVRRSCIVQAPAGSGKTELLIRRLLVLLTQVDAPEEVVAITFTRKAAAEMRHRVLEALAAADGEPPEARHKRLTWRLARAVARRDRAKGWELRENPNRLRTHTIDALCHEITRRRPLASGFGGQPALTDDAAVLYRQAALATLARLEGDDGDGEVVGRLLLHLDNDHSRAERMLGELLARREQWLRHLPSRGHARGALRRSLERALERIIVESIAGVRSAFPAERIGEVAALARFGAEHLRAGKESALASCRAWTGPNGESGNDESAPPLEPWLGVAELLLTGKGSWRKKADIAIGFPAAAEAVSPEQRSLFVAMKQRHERLLLALGNEEVLRERLHRLRTLPYARYPEEQWALVEALLHLLPLATEELRRVFAENGCVDFGEVAQAALAGLVASDDAHRSEAGGGAIGPVRHLLVDEFQDTSYAQVSLLERLTAGWTGDDGRTVFLVGDPMQSIYRFREAEVGLYLRTRRRGLGRIRLERIRLTVNFRSAPEIVAWVNGAFSCVFPPQEEITTGAVPFSLCAPAPGTAPGGGVEIHPLGDDGGEEGRTVAGLAGTALSAGSVAILVRSRGHLASVLPALRAADVPYRAIEIDALAQRPVVQDLLALTRALLNPADRIAWLAVLRAPWCGLRLEDLLLLAGEHPDAALRELMLERADLLHRGGEARLGRVRAVLAGALAGRGRTPLRRWLEGTWVALGGPACVDEMGLRDARVYFDLLEGLDESEALDRLPGALEKLYAPPDPVSEDAVQVMTIHKAKGLEFDTVILPGLGRRTRGGERHLLLWNEWVDPTGGRDALVLATINQRGRQDACYDYLRELHKEKDRHETARLIYVAATRARRRLHLLGHAPLKGGDGGRSTGDGRHPPRGSLLAVLWPALEAAFAEAAEPAGGGGTPRTASAAPPPVIHRLRDDWRPPPPPPPVVFAGGETAALPSDDSDRDAIEFSWAGKTIRHIGTVVHRSLQRLAVMAGAGPEWVERRRTYHRNQLLGLGVPRDELDWAVARVEQALRNTLADERGRWVLAPHGEAQSETALTAVLNGEPVHVIIDRTFVDEQGVRWIIDFKAGFHEGADTEAFLDRERDRYRPQLERYARVLARQETRPIRLALYYPLHQAWREWPAPAAR